MSFGSSGNESCHFQASDHGWDVQSLSYTQSNHDRSQQMHSNDAEISVKEMYHLENYVLFNITSRDFSLKIVCRTNRS